MLQPVTFIKTRAPREQIAIAILNEVSPNGPCGLFLIQSMQKFRGGHDRYREKNQPQQGEPTPFIWKTHFHPRQTKQTRDQGGLVLGFKIAAQTIELTSIYGAPDLVSN